VLPRAPVTSTQTRARAKALARAAIPDDDHPASELDDNGGHGVAPKKTGGQPKAVKGRTTAVRGQK
jgi:hypothetical protein